MATGISKTKWNGDLSDKTPNKIIEHKKKEKFTKLYSAGETDNRLYFGENLSVLKELVKDKTVKGKVNLIYIDPPYATNSVFQTREQKDAYTDLLKGEDYLSFFKERLILLKELLSEQGSIYVHLDNKIMFHVKVLMDEIFGVNNFRNLITRKKCKTKNTTRNSYGNISDYILYYSKTTSPIWNRSYENWSDEKMLKEYPFIEKETGRRYKKVPVHAPGTRNGETGKEWKGMMPPPGKHWQYTPAKLDEMDSRGEIYWSGNGNPRRKVYFDESNGIPVQDIWLDFLDIDNQNTHNTGYPTEKNPDLLKRIILASSNEGDLVLDCFAGSGTTLFVAEQSNRRWIGADIGTEAISTILKRFSNGTNPLGDYVNKKSDAKENKMLSLFDELGKEEKSVITNLHTPILNFSLFAELSRELEAKEILDSWNKII